MAVSEQVKGLADLLVLQQRLRRCVNEAELCSFVANDTRQLFAYRTAVIWSSGCVVSVSGLPEPVRDAPFTRWTEHLCSLACEKFPQESIELTPSEFPSESADEWGSYLPSHVLWLPLTSPTGEITAYCLLARDKPWKPEEKNILTHWAGAVGHALDAVRLRKRHWWQGLVRPKSKRVIASVVALILILAFVPVRVSVIAPAEIVPRDPLVVRAPMEGVIGEVLVQANQFVERGQAILTLDEASLRARLDVAEQELEVAKAEHLRAEQASLRDRSALAQVYMLNSRIEQRSAEVAYVTELLDRASVNAEEAGIAMIDDVTELKGRPVALGERILTIANPNNVELEAWLSVDDSIPLTEGAQVKLYLNISPGSPVHGEVKRIDYQAQVSPEGVLAFRLRAHLQGDELPRIGLRGSVRVYGERAPLYYYLFRKPLASLRQFVGF